MKPANWWQKNLRPVLETYRPRNFVYNGDEPVHKWVEAHLKNGDAKSQTLFPEPIRNHRLETGELLIQLAVHLGYHLGQVSYHRRLVTGDVKGVGALNVAELGTGE